MLNLANGWYLLKWFWAVKNKTQMFTIFKWTIVYEQLKNVHILLYIIIILIYYVFYSPSKIIGLSL